MRTGGCLGGTHAAAGAAPGDTQLVRRRPRPPLARKENPLKIGGASLALIGSFSGGIISFLGAAGGAAGTTTAVGGCLLLFMMQRRRKQSGRYPSTRRCKQVDEYFGEKVYDPYRWLEDPESKEVVKWVDDQNKYTHRYFDANLEPARKQFHDKMTKLYDYDKYGTPFRQGDLYFFFKKEGLQSQYVLWKQDSLDGEPEVLLDPNTLREDGTAALRGTYFSKDGTKLAYGVSYSGSDWFSVLVKDVLTGAQLTDKVDWCKFCSIAWAKAGGGFFYSSFPRPQGLEGGDKSAGTEVDASRGHRVFYHRLGTDTENDQLVYDPGENDEWLVSCSTSEDEDTLLISIHDSCKPVNRLFYCDMSGFDGKDVSTLGDVVKAVDHFEHKYDYITNEGRTFWFITNADAPKYKVITMDFPPVGSTAEKDAAALAAIKKVEVVPEDPAAVLDEVRGVAGDQLLLLYLRDAHNQLEICDMAGGPRRNVPLSGGIGSLHSLWARRKHTEFFFQFTSFTNPGTTYRGMVKPSSAASPPPAPRGKSKSPATSPRRDSNSGTSPRRGSASSSKSPKGKEKGGDSRVTLEVYRQTIIPGVNPEEFETKQIRYKSKDGTSIPMFIVGQKGQRGATPCILYGYGGFNISITPSFSISRLIWMKNMGGRYCVANIRGGGEYGEEWYNAGKLDMKQNCFDDFIAGGEYLCTTKLTTPQQLAINGGSNGGLLVCACINQKPELFGAAVSQVGVLDMLRFHKFTIGYAWCSDFGNPDADQEQYKTLLKYSPVHNINPAAPSYPATLLTTGDHDDRVVPLHSYKYIAQLQETIGSRPGEPRPQLIRIDTKSGHGAGKPTAKVIEEGADIYAFIAKHTGAVWQDS